MSCLKLFGAPRQSTVKFNDFKGWNRPAMLGKRKNSSPLSNNTCEEPPEKLYVDEQFLCDHMRDMTLLKKEKEEVIDEDSCTISISEDVRRQWEKFTRDVLPPKVVEDITKSHSLQMVVWKPLPIDEITKNSKINSSEDLSIVDENSSVVENGHMDSANDGDFYNNNSNNNNNNNNNNLDRNLNNSNNQSTNQFIDSYEEEMTPMNGITFNEDFYMTANIDDCEIDDNEIFD